MTTDDAERSAGGARYDRAPRETIRALQDDKVGRQARWVYSNSSFWQERFDDAGCEPEQVNSVEDLAAVPFGTKAAYRTAQAESPPYGGLLCRDESSIHESGGFVWETSGTTGTPVRFLCSQTEYDRVDVAATRRILSIAGLDPGDTVAMFWPLTLWAVGHGIVDACRQLDMTVLPLGPSYSTEFRVHKVAEYRPDTVMTTPTYAMRLATVANGEGIDPAGLGVERVIVSGEPLPDPTRQEIAAHWGVDTRVYDYYGLSEAFNGRSIECEEHDGIHVLEDLYLYQVVEPDGRHPVEEGETGELVVTALEQRDIASGFHYRTGDLARYTDARCGCGRTSRRIEIISRKDDMKTVRGVNVYPQAVEALVRELDGLGDEFRLVLERDGSVDRLTVVVEPVETMTATDERALRQRFANKLERAFGGLSVEVELVDPGTLDRFDFKANRWIDRR